MGFRRKNMKKKVLALNITNLVMIVKAKKYSRLFYRIDQFDLGTVLLGMKGSM